MEITKRMRTIGKNNKEVFDVELNMNNKIMAIGIKMREYLPYFKINEGLILLSSLINL